MRIGIDLDNTLVDYETIFLDEACAQRLVGPEFRGDRMALRHFLRNVPEGERQWQALQGQVYGARMMDARLMAGAADFLRLCRARGARVFIVSHRTRFGHFDPRRVLLHDAARDWLAIQGFFDKGERGFGFDPADISFETSRADKLARIRELDLDVFIDDLPDVLEDPAFPSATRGLLFAPRGAMAHERAATWPEIATAIGFGESFKE